MCRVATFETNHFTRFRHPIRSVSFAESWSKQGELTRVLMGFSPGNVRVLEISGSRLHDNGPGIRPLDKRGALAFSGPRDPLTIRPYIKRLQSAKSL